MVELDTNCAEYGQLVQSKGDHTRPSLTSAADSAWQMMRRKLSHTIDSESMNKKSIERYVLQFSFIGFVCWRTIANYRHVFMIIAAFVHSLLFSLFLFMCFRYVIYFCVLLVLYDNYSVQINHMLTKYALITYFLEKDYIGCKPAA